MSDNSPGQIPTDKNIFETNSEDFGTCEDCHASSNVKPIVETWFNYAYLESAVRKGNTRGARWLIQHCPDHVKGKAAEMENLARENNHPIIAKLFHDFLNGSFPLYNFTPSASPEKYDLWMKADMRKYRNERDRINILCFSMLNTAQSMGHLEQRIQWGSVVEIGFELPFDNQRYPQRHYLGRKPAFAGKHPDAPAGFVVMEATKGTPQYDQLMARELNQLSQEKLWWLARRMARSLDEKTALYRALAVVDYDTEHIDVAVLKYLFGDKGPFRASLPLHANAIQELADRKSEIIVPCLGPKLLAVVL